MWPSWPSYSVKSGAITYLQKTTIWSGRIFFIWCYLEIFTSCLYCIITSHFNVYVENFTSYVTLYLYVCWCHGLRLSDLNKETTYLLTYLPSHYCYVPRSLRIIGFLICQHYWHSAHDRTLLIKQNNRWKRRV